MKHTAVVFFMSGRTALAPAWCRFVARCVRFFTDSDICHCAIGFEDVVMETSLVGVRYFTMRDFVKHFPTIATVIKIKMPYRIDLDWFNPLVGKPVNVFGMVARWLSGGRLPLFYDCLSVVLFAIMGGGLDVPERTSSPEALRNWLLSQGFKSCWRADHLTEKTWREALARFVGKKG